MQAATSAADGVLAAPAVLVGVDVEVADGDVDEPVGTEVVGDGAPVGEPVGMPPEPMTGAQVVVAVARACSASCWAAVAACSAVMTDAWALSTCWRAAAVVVDAVPVVGPVPPPVAPLVEGPLPPLVGRPVPLIAAACTRKAVGIADAAEPPDVAEPPEPAAPLPAAPLPDAPEPEPPEPEPVEVDVPLSSAAKVS